jgi:hypothetical protein
MDKKDQRNGVPIGTFAKSDDTDTAQTQKAERSSLDPSEADTSPDFLMGRPSRKRVRTLLGVPLAEPPMPDSDRSDLSDRKDDISEAIQSILDDQSTLSVAMEEIDDEIPIVAESDVADYAEYIDSEPTNILERLVPEPERTTSGDARVTSRAASRATAVTDETGPALPLLIPTQYAQAQALDRDRDSESLVDTHKQAAFVAAPPLQPTIPPTPISSLAPREVRRPAQPAESTSRVGLMMVAAMALIAGGGWWMTAGSFSRSGDRSVPQAVSQPQALASAQPPVQAPPAPLAQPAQLSVPEAAPVAVAPSATPAPAVSGRSKGLASTHRPARAKAANATKQPPSAADDIPEAPSRAVVVQRLESVRSSVRACAAGRSGVADLDITIAHSGVVTHVLVGGDFAGTMQGSCIARAVREARFPSFKQERLRLLFPYAI